jgi:hypothetical protein
MEDVDMDGGDFGDGFFGGESPQPQSQPQPEEPQPQPEVPRVETALEEGARLNKEATDKWIAETISLNEFDKRKSRPDKEATDKWIAETMSLNEFDKGTGRPPSPTRGLINIGPLVITDEDYVEFWGVDE